MVEKAVVYGLNGDRSGEIDLPLHFNEEYRPDIIKRAVLAVQANRLQPYGPNRYSGIRTSAVGWGTGRGASRVPRIKNGRRAMLVPQAKGGRRAHPPKPEKDLKEKVNRKERRKAIRSAIAATAKIDLVTGRGHRVKDTLRLPLVVADEFEEVKKTPDVVAFLEKIDLWEDILAAKNSKKVRAGKGKMRGRRYKSKKSILFVIGEDKGIREAARNLPGVDVVTVDDLNAELLAPGTNAGRLTLWTASAIKGLEGKFS